MRLQAPRSDIAHVINRPIRAKKSQETATEVPSGPPLDGTLPPLHPATGGPCSIPTTLAPACGAGEAT